MSQTRAIFEHLWNANGWVPAWHFPNKLHVLQYNARIHDLRQRGLTIESRNIDGIDCFRLVDDKRTIDKETMRPIVRATAVGENRDLFGGQHV